MTKSITISTGPVSNLGDVPSFQNETITLFHLEAGLKSLVGESTLHQIANALPLVEYDGGDFLIFNSPDLKVPGYGTYDLRAYAGFGINIGAYMQWGYDFGDLTPTVQVSAPRVDGTEAYMSYVVDTNLTSVLANLQTMSGTDPFYLRFGVGGDTTVDANGNTVINPGYIAGGLLDAGVYKNGNPTSWTYDFGLNQTFDALYYDIIPPTLPGSTVFEVNESIYSGFVKVPQLPSLSVTAGGTGAGAFGGTGQVSGLGPEFANLTIRPINAIPLVGDINSQSIDFVKSKLIDAGLSYTVLGLDLYLASAFRQSLTVNVHSVNVTASAFEKLSEDDDGGTARAHLDDDDGVVDGYVRVSQSSGILGDKLILGNFSQGERFETKVREEYSITLRVNTDIDLVLTGGVKLSFLSLSAFVNPIFLDELRLNLGPVFSADFALELAAIDIYNDWFLITFASSAVIEHVITASADVLGSDDSETLTMVAQQKNINAGGGNDSIQGNALANNILGGEGNDVLYGGEGNDTLRGENGHDVIMAGAGDDLVVVGEFANTGSGVEVVYGHGGDDYIRGPASTGNFYGGDGNDTFDFTLRTGGGQNFYGGTGNDTLRIDATGVVLALDVDFTSGNGVIIQQTVFNGVTLTLESRYASIESIFFKGGEANDSLGGSNNADNIRGGNGDDLLTGNLGNDFLAGDAGHDTIRGGAGDDGLSGWSGNDSLQGEDGNDLLSGDAGDDTLFGGNGNDTLVAGDGNDRLDDQSGINSLEGGRGDDLLIGRNSGTELIGGEGNDTLQGTGGDVLMIGGDGNDLFIATTDGGTLIGNGGSDVFRVSALGGQVAIFGDDFNILPGGTPPTFYFNVTADILQVFDFSSATSSGGAYVPPVAAGGAVTVLGSTGTLSNGTTWGGIEAFRILGDNGVQRLAGGAFADLLSGGGGNDYLDGQGGADTLTGGAGDDTLVGTRVDLFFGGSGSGDLMVFAGASATTGYQVSLGQASRGLVFNPDGSVSTFAQRQGTIDGALSIIDMERLNMVSGGGGNDYVVAAEFADTLRGGAGDDTLAGLAGNDILWGEDGADLLLGGDGNDTLYDFGTAGPTDRGDTLAGGDGADSIFFTRRAALVEGGAGNDTIAASGVVAELSPTHVVVIDGGEGSDSITGTAGRDSIEGGIDPIDNPPDWMLDPEYDPNVEPRSVYDSHDTIDGAGGDDWVRGGAGNDSLDGGTGSDTVFGGSGRDVIGDSGGADLIFGGSGDDSVTAGDDADTVYGQSGSDWINGGAGADVILGDEGHDTLFGGINDDEEGDTLFGEGGNDVITGSDGVDFIDGGDGSDEIDGGLVETLGSDVETLLGGAGADTITARGDAIIDGGSGSDVINLGDGAQTVVVRYGIGIQSGADVVSNFLPGVDRLVFSGTGLSFADLILTDTARGLRISFATNPLSVLLTGVASTDIGPGVINFDGPPIAVDDALVMSSDSSGGFQATLLSQNDLGEGAFVSGVAPGDVAASLFRGVISLTVGSADGSFDYTAGNAGGTASGTVRVAVIATGAGDDVVTVPALHGGRGVAGSHIDLKAGNDSANGGAGDDRLIGGDGNDTLSGGGGNDTLFGGAGNDVLTDQSGDDSVMLGGTGDDTYVVTSTPGVAVSENANEGRDLALLLLGGTLWDNVEDATITGMEGASLTGNALGNALTGGGGHDSLSGLDGNDSLTGGSGDDTLVGGAGNDTMAGGAGDDTYVVGNAGDVLSEAVGPGDSSDAGGFDTVRSSVTYSLATPGGAFIEAMILTGTGNIGATGNALANRLQGNAGHNTLDGGLGADTMIGGAGNDTYIVNAASDRVFETTTPSTLIDAGGLDLVRSLVTFNLDATAGTRFVENLTLEGTGSINGTGNALANRIVGGTGSNILNGGLGNDTLTGGAGTDAFVFATTPAASNVDRIVDFVVADDTIWLDDAVFTGLAVGLLSPSAFVANIQGQATDASDRIIYETDTGRLFFDADGTGTLGARTLFAILSPGLALTEDDFRII